MTNPLESSLTKLHERMVELEMQITHLQRTVGDLDQVVLSQQKQIDALARELSATVSQMASIGSAGAEVRKPEDEKPPHY